MKPEIKRRRLGRTGLYVTELGFGAMNLRRGKTFENAYALCNYVIDQGVNLIDTARVYNGEISPGVMLESEIVVGNTIRQRTHLDEPIVIVTKGHGYTLPELEKDLQESLDRLGIEGRGDLTIGGNPVKLVYFLHGLSTERWDVIKNSGVLQQLEVLKKEGRVNFVGFSSHYPFPKEIKEAVDTGVFDVVELPYNVFNRSLGEDGATDLLEYIHKNDIGIVNMKAFDGNGMVAVYPMLSEFISINYDKMLNFCLSNPYITTVDAGAVFINEFEADIQTALKPRLTADERSAMKEEADKVSKHMRGLCRECLHCMEKFKCPNDIYFIDSLTLYSRYLLSSGLGKPTDELKAKYGALDKKGADCIECGKCLEWCEYKLNIPQMMKKAEEALI